MMIQINKGGVVKLQGFVDNYATEKYSNPEITNNIMQYYAPGLDGYIPITSALASAYAVSDIMGLALFKPGPIEFLRIVLNLTGMEIKLISI